MKWLLALLAACTDEVALAPNTCGNWVLEAGEDCDQPSGCTADCRWACDPVACPDGMACGLDRACHAPTGHFATSELASPLGLVDFRAGDLDGDRRADVLGIADTRVRAAFAANAFTLPFDTAAPRATGRYAIGDYDGDGRLDLVFPVAQGLATLTTHRGVPEPVLFSAVSGVRDLAIGSGDGSLTELFVDQVNVKLRDAAGVRKPCLKDLTFGQVPLRTLHPYHDVGYDQVPLLFTSSDPNNPPLICVDGLEPLVLGTLSGTVAPPVGEVFFAFGDNACPDLYAPFYSGQSGLLRYVGSGTPGSCTLGGETFSFIGAPLAAAGKRILTSGGIAFQDPECGDNLCNLAPADRAWTHGASGDFDGDGNPDFVVASTSADLEVYFGTPDADYHRVLVATGGVVTDLVAGDFDGDGRADFAFAMTDPTDPTRSVVRFGFDLQLSPAIRVAKVGALAAFQTQDPGLPLGQDRVDDLAVATTDGARTTILGSADRLPGAPFTWQTDLLTGATASTGATNVAIGGFAPDNHLGLFGVFAPAAADSAGFSVFAYAQLAPVAGGFTVGSVAEAGGCFVNGFCPSSALWLAMPVAEGTLALAFANADDTQPDECGEFYLAVGASEPFPSGMGCVMMQGPAARNRVERARDLGDGIVSTAGDGEVWTARVAFGPDRAPVFDNWVSMANTVGPGATCSDVTRLELGTRDGYGEGLDLATACARDGTTSVYAIFAAAISNPDPTPHVEKLFDVPTGGPLRLETGDVDGDGLADLLYSDGVTLRVRLQCDPHRGCP